MEYKGYRVEAMGTYPMYTVRAKGQGTIPVALRGMYTNMREVELAIDGYLNSLKKGSTNGATKGKSTR